MTAGIAALMYEAREHFSEPSVRASTAGRALYQSSDGCRRSHPPRLPASQIQSSSQGENSCTLIASNRFQRVATVRHFKMLAPACESHSSARIQQRTARLCSSPNLASPLHTLCQALKSKQHDQCSCLRHILSLMRVEEGLSMLTGRHGSTAASRIPCDPWKPAGGGGLQLAGGTVTGRASQADKTASASSPVRRARASRKARAMHGLRE